MGECCVCTNCFYSPYYEGYDDYVHKDGDGKYLLFEGYGMCVEVSDVDMFFGELREEGFEGW